MNDITCLSAFRSFFDVRGRCVSLYVLLIFALFLGAVGADDSVERELTRIRAGIEQEGMHWSADLNPIVTEYTAAERQQMLGLKLPENWMEIWQSHLRKDFVVKSPEELPAYFNWEDFDVLTGVRNQGGCGSCWDFAATAALEAIYSIYRGEKLDLSEQAVLSCATPGSGCDGNWMETAYSHFKYFGAITESEMPYMADDEIPCTQSEHPARVKISGWMAVSPSRNSIKTAVLTAPVAVAFMAYYDLFYYSGGCYAHGGFTEDQNHAILVVGWDDDMCDGEGAWRCKNSWGSYWGENGYFWIRYNDCNFGGGAALIELDTLLDIVNDGSLEIGSVCWEYDYQMEASGGTTPYNWLVLDDPLPAGLSMDSGGYIRGFPEEVGAENLTIRVQDSSPLKKIYFENFTLVINDALSGDADCSGSHSLLDVTYIINYLYKDGSPPVTPTGCDCNCSLDCNLLDATYLINYLYKEGPAPCSH
jgi:hypothetical protein